MLKSLLDSEGQSHQVRAVWREMAECITLQLSPGELTASPGQSLTSPKGLADGRAQQISALAVLPL